MHKKPILNKKISLLLISLLTGFLSFSQNNIDYIYTWHDSKIIETALHNGPLHYNYDRTSNPKFHRYLNQNEFVPGTVNYNSQNYHDVYLKYDILNDQLVFQPNKGSSSIAINLIKENTTSFTINKTTFVHLRDSNSTFNGFFEESITADSFNFYIKPFKTKKEILLDKGKFVEYYFDAYYVIKTEKGFTKISNKKDVITVFPYLKEKINNFFEMNKLLEKEDKPKFMSSLMKYIKSIK